MTNQFLRKTSLILATIAFICLFLTGCKNVRSEKQTVTATVVTKEYTEAHSDYGYHFDVLKGKYRWKFKHYPDEYNITIEYKGISKTYDNQSLYDSYKIGDEIEMELTTYYDENNNLITEGFYAPSISLPN